jgi:hypothetical protein
MNHTVAIPSSFFLNEAKHEYYDYRQRLGQELLQNSVDAGATVIRFTFDDLGYKCEDNGRGMTKERMVEALLTMGGSVKESGATGGFGAAKKLLLFAHASFAIHSNDTLVCGNGLSYRFHACLSRKGTEVGAVWANPADFTDMTYKMRNLLSKCNLAGRCTVYVNGEKFTNWFSARHANSVANLGEVYANKNRNEGENSVIVMHNGLYMFYRYISGLNRKVGVNVVGKSTDVFTQNRDGFRGEASSAFDSYISELSADKGSVIKPKARKFIIEGMDTFISFISSTFTITPAIQAAINQVRMTPGNYTATELAAAVAAKVEASATASSEDKATAESIATFVKNGGANLQTDFHFDLADSSYRKVPGKYAPNTGKPKFTALAKTWKVAVRNVLQANGLDQNFVIGFTFRSEAVATHQMMNGVSCYLINPESTEIDEGTKEEKTMKVLTTAIHEVVHSQGCQQHDEDFVRKFHNLLVPTLTKGLTWRQIVKAAKTEKV